MDLGDQVGDAVNGASGKTDQKIEDDFGRIAGGTGDVARKVDALEPPARRELDRVTRSSQ